MRFGTCFGAAQDKDGIAAAAAFAEMAADQYNKPGAPSVAQRLEDLYTT